MEKKRWKSKIKKACIEAGTYQKYFDHCIDSLAEIMEKRDATAEYYEKMGAQPVVAHKNKAGAVNIEKNPSLVPWDDLNKSALAYWRDLGLTPAGLKRLNTEAPTTAVALSALDKALAEFG